MLEPIKTISAKIQSEALKERICRNSILTTQTGMFTDFEVAFVLWIEQVPHALVVDFDKRDLNRV